MELLVFEVDLETGQRQCVDLVVGTIQLNVAAQHVTDKNDSPKIHRRQFL